MSEKIREAVRELVRVVESRSSMLMVVGGTVVRCHPVGASGMWWLGLTTKRDYQWETIFHVKSLHSVAMDLSTLLSARAQ